jgi:hypothetical protein
MFVCLSVCYHQLKPEILKLFWFLLLIFLEDSFIDLLTDLSRYSSFIPKNSWSVFSKFPKFIIFATRSLTIPKILKLLIFFWNSWKFLQRFLSDNNPSFYSDKVGLHLLVINIYFFNKFLCKFYPFFLCITLCLILFIFQNKLTFECLLAKMNKSAITVFLFTFIFEYGH